MFFGRLSTRTISQALRFSTEAPLDASKLIVNRTTAPFPKQPKEELKFGVAHTDHILEMDWTQEAGYAAPVIKPFGAFNIHPSASSLHYGLECFEGMKAYIDGDGKIRLFRPLMNMARFNSSLERLVMPGFDEEEYLKCLSELIRVEKDWIPRGRGYSLYIRPTAISTYGILGVVATQATKNYVVLSPVGPYFPEGFTAVSLLADPKFVRAWPGGTGYIKCGGNYAMGMAATKEANAQGCNQVLWLYGDDHQVTEAGTMNVFFLWTRRDGVKELITAPLDGTILPGVTRDSILTLARTYGDFEVTEAEYTMADVTQAVDEGRMIEAFGAGTAAIVCPIKSIVYENKSYAIPLDPSDASLAVGPLTYRFSEHLQDIQYGVTEFEDWSVVID